ncbi:MAG: oligosaccharide flippase family protein [Candidatus Kryptonium sp.]|nr:oligosaccharide flippase family protein [Candidatus Kryptonium sp.]
MMKWSRRKILSDFSVALIAQYLTQFILFFRNFVFAKLLGPSDFGIYASIFLFFSYGTYANLGIIDGISRIAPYEIGSGNEKKVKNLFGAGLFGLNFITSAFVVALVIYSIISPFQTIVENRFSVILTALSILLNQNFLFVILYLRIKHNFKKSYILQLFQAILDFTLSVILMLKFKVLGIFVGMMLGFLITLLFSFKDLLKEIKPNFNLNLVKEILRIGFQILIVGFTYGFLMSLDKFSVANLFEKSQMGIYSIAVGLGVIPYFISSTLGQFIGQRMLEEFGRSKLKENLKIFLDESLLVLAFITPLVSILTIAFAEPFIYLFLPKYEESLRYVDKLAIAYYFLSLGAILGTFLISINQQIKILILNLSVIPIVLFLNYVVYKNNLGLLGIAYVTFFNFFVRTFFLFIFSYGNYASLLSSIISFAKFSFPSVPILFAFALKFFIFDVYLKFYLRILISLVWLVFAVYYLLRKTQIVSNMIEIISSKIGVYLSRISDLF